MLSTFYASSFRIKFVLDIIDSTQNLSASVFLIVISLVCISKNMVCHSMIELGDGDQHFMHQMSYRYIENIRVLFDRPSATANAFKKNYFCF